MENHSAPTGLGSAALSNVAQAGSHLHQSDVEDSMVPTGLGSVALSSIRHLTPESSNASPGLLSTQGGSSLQQHIQVVSSNPTSISGTQIEPALTSTMQTGSISTPTMQTGGIPDPIDASRAISHHNPANGIYYSHGDGANSPPDLKQRAKPY